MRKCAVRCGAVRCSALQSTCILVAHCRVLHLLPQPQQTVVFVLAARGGAVYALVARDGAVGSVAFLPFANGHQPVGRQRPASAMDGVPRHPLSTRLSNIHYCLPRRDGRVRLAHWDAHGEETQPIDWSSRPGWTLYPTPHPPRSSVLVSYVHQAVRGSAVFLVQRGD
jgi:hypothetical protein